MTGNVLYEELTPAEFLERLAAAPIAYLPLGTLEWHGAHLPLGADGLQARGFFERLAWRAGGIVVPMLFVGPDRREARDGEELYGMDLCRNPADGQEYEEGRLPGSAYWIDDELFVALLGSILRQLARTGFRIVVAHGHGPSTRLFLDRAGEWKDRFGLDCLCCWGSEHDAEGLGIQVDHAAANETSLMMALRPDLVRMDELPDDLSQWPRAVAGRDPRTHATPELGARAIDLQLARMEAILRDRRARLDPDADADNDAGDSAESVS